LRASSYLVDLYCVGVGYSEDGLQSETYLPVFLTLLLLQQLLIQGVVFWILMGRSLLIRNRELKSSGISSGRIDVCSGGLEAEECLSKNGIRSEPLFLNGVCFGNFIGVPPIYNTFIL
jgi:hypothetical protein